MSLPNEIVLRPRFQLVLSEPAPEVLGRLQDAERPPFQIKRLDDHVFIKFDARASHFWSPQLQLEILEENPTGCRIYGLFGPNPTLWTFFMFLHFGVATLFVIFGIWAYSSASLGRPYGALLGAMGGMVALWFVLYAVGRAGRARGKPQMYELHTFFMGVVGG
jgi:hypothetical protein